MVEITEEMSTRPHIPSQAASQFVQRRASTVASPPPPPPPSSQLEVRESKKRNRTSWVWGHFTTSFDEDGIKWGKCNHFEGMMLLFVHFFLVRLAVPLGTYKIGWLICCVVA
ncbi:hypothetical protein C5167_031746 [Papaver somniferum]|uniref:Uncharacterized protein n=1 Tax=Papaver somniferum TaxID=3469 RepID=A0A4Y7K949_PAPSO|nr:hypothetical protein C5167_031746 [Papaver somniferum]